MKILQLGKFYPIRGGVEKVMYSLAEGLSENGVECDAMFASADGSTDTIRLNGRCRIFRCRTLKKLASTMISPDMVLQLRRICNGYDIIHVHHPDPMACLALFLSGYRGRVVLHWHSDIVKQKFLLHLYRPLQSWLIRRASEIVGTTPKYLQESPFLRDVQYKTACLPIGIDAVRPDADAVARIRERYGDRRIIFSLGRLVGYKGYEYLIDAARYLDDSYVVVIGGNGPLKGQLAEQIRREHLDGKAVLAGYLTDGETAAYYGACEMYCLSSVSRTEAFAIVQVEAMSCGKPVVATEIEGSGVSWVNADGVSGLNVPPRDGRALASAITKICTDREEYGKYCARARERFETMFERKEMINNCIEMYKKEINSLEPDYSINPVFSFVKRACDIAVASAASVIFMPLMLAAAVAVKADSKGPVIFRQERVGYKGRKFMIYKFRSMVSDAEKNANPQLYVKGDSRLTKVGRFLREHHLDELPQLWNILKGDMSLVGPRPEREFYINKIMELDDNYRMLYRLRPGIFSFATLYNGYTDNMVKMLRRMYLYLDYLAHRSLYTDAKIIFLTSTSIITGKKF